jgi:glycosyltransferase involved in cell wall biosynthesis
MFNRLLRLVRRLRALPVQAYYTLSGWRFSDLKSYVDQAIGSEADSTLALLESRDPETGRPARLAVITCLPPDATGIANFALKQLSEIDIAVDVFSQVRDVAHFLRVRAVLAAHTGGRVRLHPMASLLARDVTNRYERLVFMLGNSQHNFEVYRKMETLAGLGAGDRIVCHLHDPCCHNVVQLGKGLEPGPYLAYLGRLYDNPQLLANFGSENWQAHKAAVDAGILGIRTLFDVGVRHFIVNSEAAARIVREDLSPAESGETRVDVLYHPVFEPEVSRREAQPHDGNLIIGTFGAPSVSKGTNVVLAAVRELRRRGVKAKLIIAGFDADYFADGELARAEDRAWLELAEPTTERELQLDMLKCDIAIQLRRTNLGESSGVVPSLLALGIPTIVSPIGAFAEYGEAVGTFDGYDPVALADLLEARPQVDELAMQRYAREHSLAAFNARFLSMLDLEPAASPVAQITTLRAQP